MSVPTGNSFLKIVPVSISSGNVSDGYISALSYDNRVEDTSTISVYFNGQLIERDNTNSKYYYTIANTIDATYIDPSNWTEGYASVADGSHLDFTISCNPDYRAAGYDSGTSVVNFTTSDSIVISYYYVVYMA